MVKAPCASDIEAVAEVVGRLRLDGRVMSKAEFERAGTPRRDRTTAASAQLARPY